MHVGCTHGRLYIHSEAWPIPCPPCIDATCRQVNSTKIPTAEAVYLGKPLQVTCLVAEVFEVRHTYTWDTARAYAWHRGPC